MKARTKKYTNSPPPFFYVFIFDTVHKWIVDMHLFSIYVMGYHMVQTPRTLLDSTVASVLVHFYGDS